MSAMTSPMTMLDDQEIVELREQIAHADELIEDLVSDQEQLLAENAELKRRLGVGSELRLF